MKPIKADDAGDSEDLQALFDSIAAGGRKSAPPPPEPDPSGDNPELEALFDTVAATSTKVSTPPPSEPDSSGDNPELEALFDSVSAESAPPVSAVAESSVGAGGAEDVVFNRLGQLARQLHDSLRELGYDRLLEDAAEQIPDARQRLAYIAQMTEQAASRVLNATDIAKPMQDELIGRSSVLSAQWDKLFANQLSVDEFKKLAAETRSYFHEAPSRLQTTNDQLMEIVMAQDFQDLTGQVIKKVVELANSLEQQMLKVLIEVMPETKKAGVAMDGLMNGPVIDGSGREDVVTDQSQVDDLLESLGF